MCVFLERLVEHADEEKTPFAPGRRLGELLEQVDIRAVLRSAFEELAHLVDEQDQPSVRSGLFGGSLGQGGD